MQTTTAANTDRADQLEALGFTGEADYAEHQGVMQKMRELTTQQLRNSRAAGGLELVHLSETGLHAGRRLCLAPKDQSSRSVHAMYAPLHNPTFLASVCEKCLHTWVLEAYEDGDDVPDYLVEARAAAKLAAAKAAAKAAANIVGEKGGQ
jgi:hypothetical protein